MSNRVIGDVGAGPRRFDRFGAIAGLVLAALVLPLWFLSDALFVQVVPILVGFASALYLATDYYGRDGALAHSWRVSITASQALRGATLLGIGTLAVTAAATGGRTGLFVAIAALVGGLIFVQILFVRDAAVHPGGILLQVVAFAVVLRFAALATTPGLVGVDAWTHVTTYAGAIRDAGSLGAIADVKYFMAPLYHLFAVVAAEAFNTSIRVALYATLGLVMPISVLLVYLTTRHFLPVRWSLFAVAVYAVGDHVIRWGVHLIPTSMGLVFFMAIVYGSTKLSFVEDEGPVYALTLLVGLAVVLTHQISAFITLVFLGAGVLAQLLIGFLASRTSRESIATADRSTNLVPLFAFVAAVTALNWALTPHRSGSFIESMFGNLGRALSGVEFLDLSGTTPAATGALADILADVPLWVEFLDSLGLFLLLTGVVLGSLVLLRIERLSQLSLTYVLAAAAMLVVTLGLPLFGLTLLIPGRWFAFMYVPMAIVATIGLRYVVARLSTRSVVAGLLVVALVFPGAMLVSQKAAPEGPVFDQEHPRYAATGSELAAVETISDIHPASAGALRTDHPYRTVFTRWQDQAADGYDLSDDGLVVPAAAVYRTYQSSGAASARYGEEWVQVHLTESAVCSEDGAVLYDNGDVRYCRNTIAP